MNIVDAEFIKSSSEIEGYPNLFLPEIAFYGRSNCGKSSLINTLVNRKGLVKTGSKPGMTRLINFFLINKSFVIADMPGYGFADLPEHIRNKFQPMVDDYLTNRQTLKMLLFLLDIRRSPGLEEIDKVNKFKSMGIPYKIVATKADKLSRSDTNKSVRFMAGILGENPQEIFTSSSKNRDGRKEILAMINRIIK